MTMIEGYKRSVRKDNDVAVVKKVEMLINKIIENNVNNKKKTD